MIPAQLIATAVLALASLGSSAPLNSPPTVTVTNGTLTGKHLASFNQDAFLGIPYAQPPVGDLRFAPAKPIASSWGTKEATDYGSACFYVSNSPDNIGLPLSEDCLTINVVRPAGCEGQNLPVGLWIHGGGNNWGASARELYNLSYPVQQSVEGGTPIIGVSINYRTNGFGFLASKEVDDIKGLNNGLKDQRLAIRWVQENIAAFGGDPSQVTIWGESAGSGAVAYQMLAYGETENPPFQRGIMESGNIGALATLEDDVNRNTFGLVLESANCIDEADPLACLRKLPASQLSQIFNETYMTTGMSFGPVVDYDFIPDLPLKLLNDGNFAKIPVIVGANSDEGTSSTFGNVNTTTEVELSVKSEYPYITDDIVENLLQLYPDDPALGCPFNTGDLYSKETYGLQYKRGNAIAGDLHMVGPRRRSSRVYSKYSDVYAYNFNVSDYGTDPSAGASHFQEVVYVFDNPTNLTGTKTAPMGPDPDGSKKKLGDLMSRFFMSFIATGDPNNANYYQDYKPWPVYANNEEVYYFHLDDSYPIADDFRKDPIDYIIDKVDMQYITYGYPSTA
uniref:Carboxylic ester hydrolase n=1 Tax=Blastobotrys adeninivorans TaxID=409370 RepID=A0A060T877_BLAAD